MTAILSAQSIVRPPTQLHADFGGPLGGTAFSMWGAVIYPVGTG